MNEFQKRIGVGETHYGLARTGPIRKREVIIERGPQRGQVGGFQTDHKDGRMDATVRVPAAQHVTPLAERMAKEHHEGS